MVVGGHVEVIAGSQDVLEPSASGDPDAVLTVAADGSVMPVVADKVRNVLVQRTAQTDVEDLHTAADSE
jgi:hypothetical protein